MSAIIDIATARRALGSEVIGPDEVHATFGATLSPPAIPYSIIELEAAAAAGNTLILHVDHDATGPLTLHRLIERFPASFDARLLRSTGYQLKDDWGIELEPRASRDTCSVGWLLVRKEILDPTRNLTYDAQHAHLAHYAQQHQWPATSVRRRTAVEIAYDLVLYQASRGTRLLEHTWDWSSSSTLDAGYLNVGGFGPNGMQILSYSTAVRHGALGVCPVHLPVSVA